MSDFIKDKEELLEELHTDLEDGLASNQVLINQNKYGSNELTKKKSESLIKRIWNSTKEPMILMLIAAGIIALTVNIILAVKGDEADFLECVGIFVAIFLSIIITVIMEGKSAKAFEMLNKISDDALIKVVRNKKVEQINKKYLVVGDIIHLNQGDRIPADGRLLESMDLTINESILTGESIYVNKDANITIVDEKTPLAERFNMVYSGTFITNGFCKIVVTSVGDSSEFGKIASELTNNEGNQTPLQEKLSKLGKMITIFGIIAALIVFVSQLISFGVHGGLKFEEVMEAFVTSIVLIVAAVPEGLPTIVAVSLSINIIKLSKQNALVKKMIASETIGCINVICSDKTGTLTENKMKVYAIYNNEKENQLSNDLIENFCINSTADINEKLEFIGNPTECALLVYVKNNNKNYIKIRGESNIIQVIPFSSDVKHMTTIIKNDDMLRGYVKGSPEIILEMCNLTKQAFDEINEEIAKYQKQACRVLAFSHKEIKCGEVDCKNEHEKFESDMIFDGFVAISDPLRADVYEAVEKCRKAGVSLKILTGDNILTAKAIADELKILDENHIALEAKDIEHLDDQELNAILDKICVIARSTPSIKKRIVKMLKKQGNVVAVTGDGINDAPALKSADVGIAMGISGTEVSKEASDIVLLDDSFSTIAKAIEWGRGIYENFKRFISFQLTVNIASVIVVFASILMGFKAPFTALQLLWVNIIMDGPPALSLGLEPNHDDLMNQPPVKRNESILSKSLLTKIVITAVYVSIVFLLQYNFNFLESTDEQMTTVLFTLFAFFQLFNSFNCRELHFDSIFKNFTKNKLMLLIFSITFFLQILMIQFAGGFFGTVQLPISMWFKILITSLTIIVFSEIFKLIYRIFHKKRFKI